MYYHHDGKVVLQVVAIVSVCFSFSVVATYVIFPLMRKKLFMRIIAYISLNDIMGNLPYTTVQRPPNSSIWCSLEGFCNLYFYPVGWLWTTILVYFLYSLASTGKLPLSEFKIHLICWGMPLVFTLLYLTTNNYTRLTVDDDFQVCTYGGDYTSGFIWHMVTYYGLFIACVVFMAFMYAKAMKIKSSGQCSHLNMLELATNSLRLYPVAMVICWAPEIVANILQYCFDSTFFYQVSLILKILNGVATTVIFFYKSHQARVLWLLLFGFAPKPVRDSDRSGQEYLLSRMAEQDFSVEYTSVDRAPPRFPSLLAESFLHNKTINPSLASSSVTNSVLHHEQPQIEFRQSSTEF